jgi:hypothetical protein
MARSSYDTLLSLDRYAKIIGFSPAHFNGGASPTIFPPGSNRCQDIWPQYGWQYFDHVGRDELGEALSVAEWDIAEQAGYFPAPKYISQEVHQYPRYHRRDLWRSSATNARGAPLSIKTDFGKVISMGQRATTLVGTASVAGLTMTYDFAALTCTIILPTTLTDTCELKLFTAGQSGAPEWEIRPVTSITADGVNVTIVVPSWQLILPALWEAYPTTADFAAIDITTNGNHSQSVEVRRVYTDTTVTSATLYWEPRPVVGGVLSCGVCGGTGCVACALTTQDGCFHLRDPELGLIVPTPGTYDADSGAWAGACQTVCRDPDMVKVYYLSGDYSERYLSGRDCDPLPDSWARAIAHLATARMERPFCQCGSVTPMVQRCQTDLSMSGGDKSFNVPFNLLDNPFGTRWGEVQAWRQVARVQDRVIGGATF